MRTSWWVSPALPCFDDIADSPTPQPDLKPIELDEVPKVSAAVRQAIQTRRILEKLLHRIQVSSFPSAFSPRLVLTPRPSQMTNDEDVRNALLRLHGFNLMSHILKEYPNDIRIITLVRRCPASPFAEPY